MSRVDLGTKKTYNKIWLIDVKKSDKAKLSMAYKCLQMRWIRFWKIEKDQHKIQEGS